MNSRWQANKIGLINFWYYDEQEFPFVKGRMLLRGSNGSGKSVTMQSVVPLLLDGNMNPERLDPFGSRDRKMSSYLLEEEDDRDERTGYLYLEFKRQESDTYLTVGMGIRARRGKSLDKWYFSLSDGRRIGKDFLLYKEIGEKITLSKKELENRIADGGRVFDRQQDYMEYVNRHVFGFETTEEYKEMIDLLIQLRTPKLSKDFKPSVINDILSDSLQPLSDDDLRPLTEAIENMDTMNMNLKSRTEGLQAAGKIQKVLGRYDRLVLYQKAADYVENQKNLERLKKREDDHRKEREQCASEWTELETEQERLTAKKLAMDQELESLKKSDAVELNARRLRLSEQMENQGKSLDDKKRQLEAKEERRIETEAKQKEEENKEYLKSTELKSLLEEMQDEADEMEFQEHAFFQSDFEEDLSEENPQGASQMFTAHQNQFDETRERICKGTELLREAESKKRLAEDALKRKEKHQKETDTIQRKVTELEGVLIQVEEEWKEKLYAWQGQNRELILSEEQLQTFAAFADAYGKKSDFTTIRNATADAYIGRKEQMQTLLNEYNREKAETETQRNLIEEELRAWEEHKEPEPSRSEAVIRNRQRLKEKGIPYLEFYKLLEFGSFLEKEACDRLEEALMRMGILDALVVEEQFRDVVLTVDPECCDRYLFVSRERVENSLLDVMELDPAVDDIFLNQRVTGILSGIEYLSSGSVGSGAQTECESEAGVQSDSRMDTVQGNVRVSGDTRIQGGVDLCSAHTVIMEDGTYRIGAVTGTVTGTYEAGFIGVHARERNRKAQIEICRKKLLEISAETGRLCVKITELENRLTLLEKEYRALPGDEDMRAALLMLDEEEQKLKTMKEEGLRLDQEYIQLTEEWKECQKAALILAEKLYLPCNYDAFYRAEKAAEKYHTNLARLKAEREVYRHIVMRRRELMEQIELLDADMDDIRYEKRRIESESEKTHQEYLSVIEQLKLTDYEQIRQRLDLCMEWLEQFQGRMNHCTEEKTRKAERIKVLEALLSQDAEELSRCIQKDAYLEASYERENALGYVELQIDESALDVRESAIRTEELLQAECRGREQDEIVRALNQVYYENRAFLNDYQPQQAELFADQESIPEGCRRETRLDITARYQGVQIPFHRLISCLEQEIEELKDLIRARDRELFEDILANTVSRKIRGKINSSNAWVEKMNSLMNSMDTSSGLRLSLRWRSKNAETEEQLDTKDLVELLKKDYRLMREDEASRLSRHFRSKVEEARRNTREGGGNLSFYQVMKDTLDYRKWFEFQLFSQKSGEKKKELTNSVFGTFSGGEKAMSMYVPLFSAVVAKYQGGSKDAPRLISLDEAFAGVDNRNIRDMFRLMAEFEFDFIINSQVLWGDADTLDALAIYQLIRPENARFVTVMPYLWNGRKREMLETESQVEERVTGNNGSVES